MISGVCWIIKWGSSDLQCSCTVSDVDQWFCFVLISEEIVSLWGWSSLNWVQWHDAIAIWKLEIISPWKDWEVTRQILHWSKGIWRKPFSHSDDIQVVSRCFHYHLGTISSWAQNYPEPPRRTQQHLSKPHSRSKQPNSIIAFTITIAVTDREFYGNQLPSSPTEKNDDAYLMSGSVDRHHLGHE